MSQDAQLATALGEDSALHVPPRRDEVRQSRLFAYDDPEDSRSAESTVSKGEDDFEDADSRDVPVLSLSLSWVALMCPEALTYSRANNYMQHPITLGLANLHKLPGSSNFESNQAGLLPDNSSLMLLYRHVCLWPNNIH